MKQVLFMLLVLFGSISLTYGQRTVSGKVTDTAGEAVIGANVVVKEANGIGTITDVDGMFQLAVPANGTTLIFSYTGYESQEIAIAGQSVINVQMAEGKLLDEVVVTALGIKRSDRSIGYSVAKVDGNNLRQNSEPDILKGLQGKVAGVDIRLSQGTPGAATKISIRGNTSLFGKNEPLIIVDGVPLNNDQVSTSSQTSGGGAYSSGLSSLDQNDIASINILKGAAAAALYGSRASNGAMVITTKSGSGVANKGLGVTVSSSFSLENIANLPDYQNSYGAGTLLTYANANGSWGPKFGTIDSIPGWPAYLAAYPSLFSSTKMTPYVAQPNNVKNLFRTGRVYDNSISISSGTDKTSLSATASYLTHDGYVPNSNFNRASLSLGGSARLNDKLTVGGNFSYSLTNQTGSVFGENQVAGATSSFARTLFLARNWNLDLPYQDAKGNPLSTNPAQYDNPKWALEHNVVKTIVNRNAAGMRANYEFNSWLSASYNIGTNVSDLSRREVIDIGSRGKGGLGEIIENNYRIREVESNLILTFTPKITDDIGFKGLLGHNVNSRNFDNQLVRGTEIIAPGIYQVKNTKTQIVESNDLTKRRLYGIYTELGFDYKETFFYTFTARNDRSSTLPKDNNSYFYTSHSGSVNLSKVLGFDENQTYLKLRASYAKVGRDANPYSLQNTYNINTPFNGVSSGSVNNVAANPNLKPEFTTDKEVGAEIWLLSRRIGLDAAYYTRISTNMIAPITLPGSSGFQSTFDNFGKMSNKGVELALTLVPVRAKDFEWNLRGVFTKNVNKIEELKEGVQRILLGSVLSDISPYAIPGYAYGTLWGTKSARDEQGNLLVNPANGQLIRDPNPGVIGDPNPDFKLGLSSGINYKGFNLNVLFDYTKGGDLYSVTVNSLLGRGVTKDTEARNGGFVIPGYYGDANTGKPLLDEQGNKIPNTSVLSMNELYFGETFAINSATEWQIYDATVWHLREVSLGYNLPNNWYNKLGIGGINLSVSGRNLWFLAPNLPKYTNFDPESASYGNSNISGIELSAAPTTRRYGINLKVTF